MRRRLLMRRGKRADCGFIPRRSDKLFVHRPWPSSDSGPSIIGTRNVKGGLTMNRTATMLSIAAAFAAGCAVTHVTRPALAAPDMIAAQVVHTGDLGNDALSPPNASGMRYKNFISVEGMTLAVQDGNPPKHLHNNANEIQYVLEGSGTMWRGGKEGPIKRRGIIIL